MTQVVFAAAHQKSMGAMKLDNEYSSLAFVSIKKGAVGEVHTIKDLSGSWSPDGNVNISLNLNSVDTKIAIRDERMKKHLFETSKYPTARISANISSMPPKGVSRGNTEVTVQMHGMTKTVPVAYIAVNTGDKIVVSSAQPLIINAADFGMDKGVKMLQELAKLPSIATAVPVSFVVTFGH